MNSITPHDYRVRKGEFFSYLQKLPKVDGLDQFGGHKKTDPAEIALVKRIDYYLLPVLWLMYCEYCLVLAV